MNIYSDEAIAPIAANCKKIIEQAKAIKKTYGPYQLSPMMAELLKMILGEK